MASNNSFHSSLIYKWFQVSKLTLLGSLLQLLLGGLTSFRMQQAPAQRDEKIIAFFALRSLVEFTIFCLNVFRGFFVSSVTSLCLADWISSWKKHYYFHKERNKLQDLVNRINSSGDAIYKRDSLPPLCLQTTTLLLRLNEKQFSARLMHFT